MQTVQDEMIYSPEYLTDYIPKKEKKLIKKYKNQYYETYVWFQNLRTHSDGNACQPMRIIYVSDRNKKYAKKNKPFKVDERQYSKVCIMCNLDEEKYINAGKKSYT